MIISNNTFVVAQFSDCHLFADKQATHFGANVWQNLTKVLADISQRKNIDCVVFTGDLTQDHSELSYQHFVQAIEQAKLSVQVHFLAGNHDDRELLTKHLKSPNFDTHNTINHDVWQIQLLDSKSDTPSGLVNQQYLQALPDQMSDNKYQLLMMHHHPINVGYYIDKHGLLEQDVFWQNIVQLNNAKMNIKAIACGHVHRATHLSHCNVDVYTCPATSVQFGDTKEKLGSIKPSYRLFYLANNGEISSDIISF
jgi:Icc protein